MRVLLIEDDGATAQSIELMLKSEGFNFYTTDTGEDGIDRFRAIDPSLARRAHPDGHEAPDEAPTYV